MSYQQDNQNADGLLLRLSVLSADDVECFSGADEAILPVSTRPQYVMAGHHVHRSRARRVVELIDEIHASRKSMCVIHLVGMLFTVPSYAHVHDCSVCDAKDLLPLAAWTKEWNNVIFSEGSPDFASKKQRWVAANFAPGLTIVESDRVLERLRASLHRIAPYGVDVFLGELMLLRNSTQRAKSHYAVHGSLIRTSDDFRINDSVMGYNPFRSEITYGTSGGLRRISNNFDCVEEDEGPFSYLRLDAYRKPDLHVSGLPFPDQVILATFGDQPFSTVTGRWEQENIEPDARACYESLFQKDKLNDWNGACLGMNTDGVGISVSVSVSNAVMRLLFWSCEDGFGNCQNELIDCCLGFQWLADSINAAFGRWYPNPVVSRIKAAVAASTGMRLPHDDAEIAVMLQCLS